MKAKKNLRYVLFVADTNNDATVLASDLYQGMFSDRDEVTKAATDAIGYYLSEDCEVTDICCQVFDTYDNTWITLDIRKANVKITWPDKSVK